MNAELVLAHANILTHLVSRRVRPLTDIGGAASRAPIMDVLTGLGVADIGLCETIEDKMNFEMLKIVELIRLSEEERRRPRTGQEDSRKGELPHALAITE